MENSVPTPFSSGQHLHKAYFRYSDSLDDQQIRLLYLKSGHGDEKISLDIQTYNIDDLPPYIALSYTWGDPDDTVNVLCNGKVIAVTRNLKEALWQFREDREKLIRLTSSITSPNQLLHFWIDAICINQKDNKEKSFQVGFMAEIYQRARHVFTWLGPADKSSDIAIRCIDKIGEMAEDCGLEDGVDICREIWHEMVFGSTETCRPIHSRITIQEVDGSLRTVSRKALKDLFDAVNGQRSGNLLPVTELKDFFTRPWWTRMWVLQEITFSKDTHLICGSQRLKRTRCNAFINVYAALWMIMATKAQRDQTSLNLYHRCIVLNLFHHRPNVLLSMPRIHRQSKFSLAALLRATCVGSINLNHHGPHNFESTKPEDKIFALLGLAADREELKERYGVVPKYGVPYEQTFATTMAALLQQGHVALLSMCQASRSSDLPSWVPDWSRSITDMLQDVRNDHMTVYPEFSASGHRTHGTSSIKVFDDDGVVRRISIRSHIYDKVYEVGRFANRKDSKEVPLLQTLSWPIDWLLEVMRLSYCGENNCKEKVHKGFQNRLLASARTSIGDVGWDKDGEYKRVGNDRFSDAVCLLGHGIKRIGKGRFKLDAQRFIKNQEGNSIPRYGIGNSPQLAMEIMGKSLGRLPFVTRKGHLGLSSEHVMQGDVIAIIEGSQVPFVLRPKEEGQFSLVSEAYVDGIMDGEAADNADFSHITLV